MEYQMKSIVHPGRLRAMGNVAKVKKSPNVGSMVWLVVSPLRGEGLFCLVGVRPARP